MRVGGEFAERDWKEDFISTVMAEVLTDFKSLEEATPLITLQPLQLCHDY